MKAVPMITDDEFIKLSEFIKVKFGIDVPIAKKEMLASRLDSLLLKGHFKSFDEYYQYVLSDTTDKSLNDLINKVSTNFSYFYREEKHFEYYTKTVLPEVLGKLKTTGSIDIRTWVAGCATGEEAYTLAMLNKEILGNDITNWDATILATDISEQALNLARKAEYNEECVKNLPDNLQRRFLNKIGDDRYEVEHDLRQLVLFRRLNLTNEVFPFKKKFHMIFCRNVMIYFDGQGRNDLIKHLCEFLEVGGYIFIGHSEIIDVSLFPLENVIPALYKRL